MIKSPKITRPIRIAQISDVHLGLLIRESRLERILEKVKAASPDIFVSTGDLVDGQTDNLNGVGGLLREIRAPVGKFAVTGNHEFYAGLGRSLEFMKRAGFQVLRGEATTVAGLITIAGVDDPVVRGYGGPTGVPEKELLLGLPGDRFTLLLKHRQKVEKGAAGLFDLQLSGHAHKGQIFPFSLIHPFLFPHIAGLYDLSSGSFLYVSRGSGTWGPPIRFLAPPEVTVIDLLPGESTQVMQPKAQRAGCDQGSHAVSLGVSSKTYGLGGLRIGWIATHNRALYDRMAALKDYTTICNSAPSEFLAERALRNHQHLVDRNIGIIRHNLAVIDDLFARLVDLFEWVRPRAGSMAFPRLLCGDVEDFCDRLVRKAGVLLLPGSVYSDQGNHFRLGLARMNLPQAVMRLDDFLSVEL